MRISDWRSDVCSSDLENGVLADDFVEDIPDFRLFLLDQLLGLLDGRGVTLGVEAGVDERLEQFERHLLRQAALVQLQFRAGHDDRTAGIARTGVSGGKSGYVRVNSGGGVYITN